ncbi:recombination regulator RecX [Maricurvus nonylphenolicus]|uniref:regulatory protein RecX n=1 Tax=Maricurvus nonylphenolicus TaxID=1008307 RepID=UPI0036F30AC8
MDDSGLEPSAEQKSEIKDIRFAAMDLLARREHSRRELLAKLRRRFNDVDTIESVIDRLSDENLQSDDRFTEAYTRMRKRKGYGPVRILMELREKGIADDLASGWVYDEEHDWYEAASLAWQKKFNQLPRDPKERAKQMRFLQYRGFSSDHIAEALSCSID